MRGALHVLLHWTLSLTEHCLEQAWPLRTISEQPARDRAEHGALRIAVRLKSVLVRISILSSCISLLLYISGFEIVVRKRVTFIWYASSFQRNI